MKWEIRGQTGGFPIHHRPNGRVAQPFDLAGTTNVVGAPRLRVFCARVGAEV